MAGAGYKQFADGDVLTAAQVQTFLQDQAVMRFADSSARDAALGTAVAEGMVAYLDDTNTPQYYDGSSWTDFTPSSLDASVITSGVFDAARIPDAAFDGFDSVTTITSTNSSWPIPSLGNTVVKVTVIGGGGGGGCGQTNNGANGNSSSFSTAAGTLTASGGLGGHHGAQTIAGDNQPNRHVSANGGMHTTWSGTNGFPASNGYGGEIEVAYYDLDGISTANVTVGAGGAGGAASGGVPKGGNGGNGIVIFEYKAA